MPTIELDINGTPTRVDVESTDPTSIDDVARHLSGATPPPVEQPTATATTTTPVTAGATGALRGLTADEYDQMGPAGKFGVAGYDKLVHPVAEAGKRLATGQSFRGGVMQTLGDVADVAKVGPFAPFTAADILADTAAGTAGADRSTASTIGTVVNVVTSLGGMVKSGVGAIANRLRAPSTAVVNAADELATVAPEVAGAAAKTGLRGAADTAAKRYGPMFDEVKTYAAQNGSALPAGHPLGAQLSQSIDTLTGTVGQFLTAKDHAAIDTLKTAVTNGQAVPYGTLDDILSFLNARIPANPGDKVMYRFLGRLRGEVSDAMSAAVEGTPVAQTLSTARTGWRTFVAPAAKLARKLDKLTDVQAFERIGGSMKDPANARQARELLGAGSEQWAKIQGGFFGKMLRTAGGDATKLLRLRQKVAPEVWNVYTGGGPQAEQFFVTLADLQKRADTVGSFGNRLATVTGAAGAGLETARTVGAFANTERGGESPSLPQALVKIALAGAGGYGLATAAGRLFLRGATASPGAINIANQIRGALPDDLDAASVAEALTGPQDASPTNDAGVPTSPASGASGAQPAAAGEAPSSDLYTGVGRLVGLDPRFLKAVVMSESGGDPNAVSEKGAIGIAQFLPATFEQYRDRVEAMVGRAADVRNPLDNLIAGGLMYKELLDANDGDVNAAARYYHGGPDLRIHGPKTRAYGNVVAARYAQLARQGE